MRYLILFLFLVGCSSLTVTDEVIKKAECYCRSIGENLSYVDPRWNWYDVKCTGAENDYHMHEDTYVHKCKKETGY